MSEWGRALPAIISGPPGPRSREFAGRLGEVESRNVTYLGENGPVFWEEARGANVRDSDGNVYIDFTSAFGVALAGHSHPTIMERVHVQAERLVHAMGDIHPARVKLELLERLAHLAPWSDTRGVLASTGAEAIEIALKTALLASGRPGVLAFTGGYHGLTLGALSPTHRAHFRDPFQARLGDGVVWAPFPRDEEESDAALAAVAEALEAGSGSEIGTVLIEPIQGRAGVRVPPPGFLEQVGALARRSGALVVADEILTGMGRTGEYFASVAMGLVPDLVCVGKALGGGLPLSACLAPRAVMDAWPASDGEAIHTSTFLGHPLSAASALAFLDVMENEQICARARELGHAMVGLLREELAQTSVVREIRGRGLLVGIELGVRESAEPGRNGLAGVAAQAALGSGLILLPAGERGNVLELMPPVTVTEEQTKRAVEILRDVLDSLS